MFAQSQRPPQLPADVALEPATPPRSGGGRGDRALSVMVALAASLFLLFIAAPLVGLVGSGGARGARALAEDAELRGAILLTVGTATLATLFGVLGATPVAYALARGRFRGRSLLAALIDLPLLIPHPVAGIALLLVLGRNTPLGAGLWTLGLQITGSVTGIVCAMLFVSAKISTLGSSAMFRNNRSPSRVTA